MGLNRRTHLLGCIGVELLQADVPHLGAAISTGVETGGDGIDFNASSLEGNVDQGALTSQAQHHLRPLGATDQLDGILGGHPPGCLTVDADDHILGLHSGPCRRCSLNRSDNNQLFRLLVETQLNSDPSEFSRGVDLHFLEFLRIQEARVRIIEAGQHASDCLIRLPRAGVRPGQNIAAELSPAAVAVSTRGIEIIAVDDLPDLVDHLLGVIGNGTGQSSRQVESWRCHRHGHATATEQEHQRPGTEQGTQTMHAGHDPSDRILQTNEIKLDPPSVRLP